MNLFQKAIGAIRSMFSVEREVKREFKIEPIESAEMREAIQTWYRIWSGDPPWKAEDARPINFAKAITEETARLVTLAAHVNVNGSARADWMQQRVELELLPFLRDAVERGCALGAFALKPTVDSIGVYTPAEYRITAVDGRRRVTGAVFYDTVQREGYTYTKAEYHRYEGALYAISNRVYRMRDGDASAVSVSIDSVPEWVGIEAETRLENIQDPLFSVFTMPAANNIDGTVNGVSIFANALKELAALDIAWSAMTDEIQDSRPITLLDDRMLSESGSKYAVSQVKLPRYVKNVLGTGMENFYQQIVNTLQAEDRKTGINLILSSIGYKCGFSNGYFAYDQKTGMMTATQVESDDRRTIQMIKDIRDRLQTAIDGLLYAMDVYAELYHLAPYGSYQADYDFGDITYNFEEDRQNYKSLCQLGVVPWWMYLVKFEGYGEAEAKAIVAEAGKTEKGLFGAEE